MFMQSNRKKFVHSLNAHLGFVGLLEEGTDSSLLAESYAFTR